MNLCEGHHFFDWMPSIFGDSDLLKGCIRRRGMPKRYATYGLFVLSCDYLLSSMSKQP